MMASERFCGCPRRGWAKCPHAWHFNYTWQGTPHRYSLEKLLGRKVRSKTEAVTEADRLRDAIEAGTFHGPSSAPVPCAPERLSLSAFADIFFAQCPRRRGKNRGAPRGSDDRERLNVLVGFPSARRNIAIGTMTIGTIVEADVEAALASLRAKGRSSSTRNKYLATVPELVEVGL